MSPYLGLIMISYINSLAFLNIFGIMPISQTVENSTIFLVTRIVFSTEVPSAEDRENILRRIMLTHRRRERFWVSKSSALGRGRKCLRNAPPNWTEENKFRAMMLWFEYHYGGNDVWGQFRKLVRAGEEFYPMLAAHRARVVAYRKIKKKNPRGRPRGSTDIYSAEIIPIDFSKRNVREAA